MIQPSSHSVNACLAPVVSMHGLAVTTIEVTVMLQIMVENMKISVGGSDHVTQGIGSACGRLHAVQQRIAGGHGSQCGFCTPGIGPGTALLKPN